MEPLNVVNSLGVLCDMLNIPLTVYKHRLATLRHEYIDHVARVDIHLGKPIHRDDTIHRPLDVEYDVSFFDLSDWEDPKLWLAAEYYGVDRLGIESHREFVLAIWICAVASTVEQRREERCGR